MGFFHAARVDYTGLWRITWFLETTGAAMRQVVVFNCIIFLPVLPVAAGAYLVWAAVHVGLFYLASDCP